MAKTITGSAGFANQCTVPTPGDFITAASVEVQAQAHLNQAKYLKDHALLDTVAAPSGNTGTYGIVSPGSLVTALLQATAAEIAGLAMPNASTPKVSASGTTGLVRCEDLQLPVSGTPKISADGAGGTIELGNGSSTKLTLSGATGEAVTEQLQANVQLNRDDDPGKDNLLTAANILKAWGLVTLDNGTVTIHDGYNIDDITIDVSTIAEVTFVREMADANYAVTFGYGTRDITVFHGTKTTTGFSFTLYETSTNTGPKDFDINGAYIVQFHVLGRQSS